MNELHSRCWSCGKKQPTITSKKNCDSCNKKYRNNYQNIYCRKCEINLVRFPTDCMCKRCYKETLELDRLEVSEYLKNKRW